MGFVLRYQEPKRVCICGGGISLAKAVNTMKYLEMIGDVRIIGVSDCNAYYQEIYGWPVVQRKDLVAMALDGVFVAASKSLLSIVSDLKALGIPEEKIITYDKLSIPYFTFHDMLEWNQRKMSIISCNCWGGIMYHFLKSKFRSPFINMWESEEDFIKICCHLSEYLNISIELDTVEFNDVERFYYPVYRLGDVRLHMNHYPDPNVAQEKWMKRVKRVNYNDLFVCIYTDRPEVAERFEQVPYDNKVCFTSFPTDCPSAFSLDFYKNVSGLHEKKTWEIVNGAASGQFAVYNPWRFLMGKDKASAMLIHG